MGFQNVELDLGVPNVELDLGFQNVEFSNSSRNIDIHSSKLTRCAAAAARAFFTLESHKPNFYEILYISLDVCTFMFHLEL